MQSLSEVIEPVLEFFSLKENNSRGVFFFVYCIVTDHESTVESLQNNDRNESKETSKLELYI